MPNKSPSHKNPHKTPSVIPPKEEILALLSNCRDLAIRQNLTAARDSLRAIKIVADGFGYEFDHVFTQLDEAILSKPISVLAEEFLRAAIVIKSA